MRAVVQRVSRASVTVDGQVVGRIGPGLLVLVGAAEGDTTADADALAAKVAGLRIFGDAEGKMNLDVAQIGGAVLAVSQFTLLGDCRKGRRPSFQAAAHPEKAAPLFDRYVAATRALGLSCETGIFQADMKVELLNDGPVTLLVDTTKLF
ncbi:MAG: D-tyrosyl-tRNA(Tyr) deacylase [Myxococcales bacterium]|nr:D-tyrosyl-tRNA(Tyr) deacylase [Myxococcales bacterium]MCB9543057.1 D-tyrosyl-tRNA(Tyr) deacylase [Myxococcales bacterium]MCB9551589.1 D-tyrosyl-tRNA(Tyr) deacylase [Myxococcales bacterium]